MSQVNVVFYKISSGDPLAKEIVNAYRNNSNFKIDFLKDENEINQYFTQVGSGVFIFKVTSKEDLTGALAVLKTQSKLIKKGLIKASCFLTVKNKKIDDILHKFGCGDILEPGITGKTFKFKMDFWARALQTLMKKDGGGELQLKKTGNGQQQKGQEAKKADFTPIKALDLTSDIWIIKNKVDCKKILRRYLFRVMGPSPYVGQWIELPKKQEDTQSTWKFAFKSKDGDYEKYIQDDGAWYFVGSKPDFDWKSNIWNFSSDTPHLYFYTAEKTVFSRFKFEAGTVLVAENSEFALMKENFIIESFEQNLSVSGEGAEEVDPTKLKADNEVAPELKGTFENEGPIDTNMEGESSTDQIDAGPLKGKLKNGGVEEIDDRLEGKSKTDNFIEDNLEGNISNYDEEKSSDPKRHNMEADEIDGYLRNKNFEAEKKRKALKDQGFKDDDPAVMELTEEIEKNAFELAKRKKEKEAFAGVEDESSAETEWADYSEEMAEDLSGKSSSDKINAKPFSGKLKQDEVNASGPYSGKNKTDKIEDGPLSGKLKTDEVEESSGGSQRHSSESHSNKPVKGKFKGKIGVDSADLYETDEKGLEESSNSAGYGDESEEIDDNNQYAEEAQTNHFDKPIKGKLKKKENGPQEEYQDYDGEGETEHIENAPLGGKIKSQEEKKKGHLGGKGTPADRYGDKPLGGKGSKADEFHDAEYTMKPEEAAKGELKGKIATEVLEHKMLKSPDKPVKAAKPKLKIQLDEEPLPEQFMPPNDDGSITVEPPIEDKRRQKEAHLEALLGGEQTNDSSELAHDSELGEQIFGSEKPKKPEAEENLKQILLGEKSEINTESGEVKVVLSQKSASGNDIKYMGKFEDLFEKELSVSCPKSSIRRENIVNVDILMKYAGQKVVMKFQGAVMEIEEHDEKNEKVILEVDKIDEKSLAKFMQLYSQRQESIHDFIKKAKGY